MIHIVIISLFDCLFQGNGEGEWEGEGEGAKLFHLVKTVNRRGIGMVGSPWRLPLLKKQGYVFFFIIHYMQNCNFERILDYRIYSPICSLDVSVHFQPFYSLFSVSVVHIFREGWH